MADDFYGYDEDEAEPKGHDNLFLWTIFILLLIGAACACWMGSFYIFGHPERPKSYALLKKLKKIDAPLRFEVTAAPPGEFLSPQKLFEKYSTMKQLELERENGELIRNYIRNYRETKKLVTYVTGRYLVMDSYELKPATDMFPTGVVTLAQAADFPQVIIEQVYTSAPRTVPALRTLLQTGFEIRIQHTTDRYDCSAVIHVERLADGRMQYTVVPILYGSYHPMSVASASGKRRLMELARPSRPCAKRHLDTPMPFLVATSVKRLMLSLSGGKLESVKSPSGNCGQPSLRPETRKICSTRE